MTEPGDKRVLVIAGPTASGKSALAMLAADAFGGVVVNADAIQMYRDLSILSARPSDADQAYVPHRLYGVLTSDEVCSAAQWAKLAAAEISAIHGKGLLPILTGGSGLYLKALIEGLAPMPDLPEPIRQAARDLAQEIGAFALHARLSRADPVMAARLRPTDTQRVTRAWEVIQATGRSLADWQGGRGTPFPARFISLFVMPERAALYQACDARFLAMLKAGAWDEARVFQNAPAPSPILRALGLRELIRCLKGEISQNQAVELAQAATRHYAKRQVTWFRHQMQPSHVLSAQFSESLWPKIFPILRGFLLTG
ncbi:MAG: tRNA (adenosine(37)-N6)-dimethylallyltransferase MiaA [Rhodospirillales bacterium]|nr:tRNA (adenosine(37)-N6)-dimethylallyltransferase MiaA [Rhodospirillales bacterium]